MKKLLVSVVLLLMLMWVKGAKNVQAAVSDNLLRSFLTMADQRKWRVVS